MPDSFTPNFALAQPEVGASRDSWGAKLNSNTAVIDEYLGYAAPIGMVCDFAGPNAPPGWLVCDGRLLSRASFSDLFRVISTWWGAGDGSTTFALPPTPGRALVGPGAFIDDNGSSLNYGFSSKAGGLYRPITQANLPPVNLTSLNAGYHSHGGSTQAGGNHTHSTDVQGGHGHNLSAVGDHTHTGYTDVQGNHQHSYSYGNLTVSGGIAAGNPYNVPSTGGTTSVAGAHQHNVQTYGAGAHSHSTDVQGWHGHNLSYPGDHYHALWADGDHAHTVPLGGSGAWLLIQNPVLVLTKIIFAGRQATTTIAGTLAGPSAQSAQLMVSPMRGMR